MILGRPRRGWGRRRPDHSLRRRHIVLSIDVVPNWFNKVCSGARIESVLLLMRDVISVVTESFRKCFEVVELFWTEKRTRPRQEWCKPSKSLPVLAFGYYSILDVLRMRIVVCDCNGM